MDNISNTQAMKIWRGRLYRIAILSVALFIGSMSLSYLATEPPATRQTMEELMKVFSPLMGLNPLLLVLVIFFNNSIKALFTILTGLFLGLGPLVFLIGNGVILGVVMKGISFQHGGGAALLSILPHGILELPAIIFSAALGFQIGFVVFQKMIRKNGKIRVELKRSLFMFVAVILPALLVAAFVEVFVTPLFIGGR